VKTHNNNIQAGREYCHMPSQIRFKKQMPLGMAKQYHCQKGFSNGNLKQKQIFENDFGHH
jgi:hypothetical protein